MVALFGGGSFGLGRCGSAAHLLDDLIQADGQTRDGASIVPRTLEYTV